MVAASWECTQEESNSSTQFGQADPPTHYMGSEWCNRTTYKFEYEFQSNINLLKKHILSMEGHYIKGTELSNNKSTQSKHTQKHMSIE